MGRRFETDRAHLNLSVEIAFLIINCHLGHSSVTYLSLLRLIRGQDPAYRATLLYLMSNDLSTDSNTSFFRCIGFLGSSSRPLWFLKPDVSP